jgi:heat shock protein HslJ
LAEGFLRDAQRQARVLGMAGPRPTGYDDDSGAFLLLTGVFVMVEYDRGDESGGTGNLWGRTFLSTTITENGQDRPLVPGTRLRLTFLDGDVRAHAGCNHLTARASVDGERLIVEDFATTRMACDAPREEQDAWLAGFLGAGPRWRLDGDDLVLSTGETEIRLVDRKAADPDRPLQGTRWVVDSIIDNQSATSVPAGAEAWLTLGDNDRVEGFTGCNTFGGKAVGRGGRITFSEIFSTKMACEGDPGRLESAVLAVLDGEVRAQVEADRLTLTRPDGRGLRLRAA